jgi:F-type H+-transporting ATPase subunit epsilon
MESTFKLEIITPYRIFYSGPAEMLIINSVDGELGILANHEPIVAPVSIGPGKVKIRGVWKSAAVSDGFLEVEGNRVTVLVGAAEWPEEIDIPRAERSLKRASERLKDKSMPWEIRRADLAFRRANTRLQIAAGIQPEQH